MSDANHRMTIMYSIACTVFIAKNEGESTIGVPMSDFTFSASRFGNITIRVLLK